MEIVTRRAEDLNWPITIEEMGNATKVLPLKKTPCQDAFKQAFYHNFQGLHYLQNIEKDGKLYNLFYN